MNTEPTSNDRHDRPDVFLPSRHASSAATLHAMSESSIWLAGGGLAVALVMVLGFLSLVLIKGAAAFWPAPITKVDTADGSYLTIRHHLATDETASAARRTSCPEWAVRVRGPDGVMRLGILRGAARGAEVVASTPDEALAHWRAEGAESDDQLALQVATFERGRAVETRWHRDRVAELDLPNRVGLLDKTKAYASRWWAFVTGPTTRSDGIWPAILGTVMLTLLACIFVLPVGVLAALYLHEYATAKTVIVVVRLAINSLAGVPAIVLGAFALVFFCHGIGVGIDELLFSSSPTPVFGRGGLLWASLTVALFALPVVITSTEQGLASVPRSMREASYACGATRWQTIERIVIPAALPGILSGAMLAIARSAGAVAPLLLVGVSDLANAAPVDDTFPYLHAERSFAHVGFHIFDLGTRTNPHAHGDEIYASALLLTAVVVGLNLAAIRLRARVTSRTIAERF